MPEHSAGTTKNQFLALEIFAICHESWFAATKVSTVSFQVRSGQETNMLTYQPKQRFPLILGQPVQIGVDLHRMQADFLQPSACCIPIDRLGDKNSIQRL